MYDLFHAFIDNPCFPDSFFTMVPSLPVLSASEDFSCKFKGSFQILIPGLDIDVTGFLILLKLGYTL